MFGAAMHDVAEWQNSLDVAPRSESLLAHSMAVGDSTWRLTTNSAAVVRHFSTTFAKSRTSENPLTLDIRVHEGSHAYRWERPLFRGREHLVVASYGPQDCIAVDLRSKTVIGQFSS